MVLSENVSSLIGQRPSEHGAATKRMKVMLQKCWLFWLTWWIWWITEKNNRGLNFLQNFELFCFMDRKELRSRGQYSKPWISCGYLRGKIDHYSSHFRAAWKVGWVSTLVWWLIMNGSISTNICCLVFDWNKWNYRMWKWNIYCDTGWIYEWNAVIIGDVL